MEQTELLKQIDELEREIVLLPRGSIAVKKSKIKSTTITASMKTENVGRRNLLAM